MFLYWTLEGSKRQRGHVVTYNDGQSSCLFLNREQAEAFAARLKDES